MKRPAKQHVLRNVRPLTREEKIELVEFLALMFKASVEVPIPKPEEVN